jgi:DNA-binding response OmpR family regulator
MISIILEGKGHQVYADNIETISRDIGANGYLEKPFEMKALIALIDQEFYH